MLVKIDTHVHTVNSRDGHTPIEVLPTLIKERGLDGVAVTDHNHITLIKTDKYIMIPGIEVSTTEGHLIGLGVEKPIDKGISPKEAIDLIQRQSGIAVIPHPYDIISHNIDPNRYGSKVDAIETINASEINLFKPVDELDSIIKEYGLAKIGGSDSHIPQTIGDAFTLIDTSSLILDDILEAIRKGRTSACGCSTSLIHRVRKMFLDGLKIV